MAGSYEKQPNCELTRPTWWKCTLNFIELWKWMKHIFLHMCFIGLVNFLQYKSPKLCTLDDTLFVGTDEFTWRKSNFDRNITGFSVNRTGKSFSRVGLDMALKQIINTEAKSQFKRHNGFFRCCFYFQQVGCYKLYEK